MLIGLIINAIIISHRQKTNGLRKNIDWKHTIIRAIKSSIDFFCCGGFSSNTNQIVDAGKKKRHRIQKIWILRDPGVEKSHWNQGTSNLRQRAIMSKRKRATETRLRRRQPQKCSDKICRLCFSATFHLYLTRAPILDAHPRTNEFLPLSGDFHTSIVSLSG